MDKRVIFMIAGILLGGLQSWAQDAPGTVKEEYNEKVVVTAPYQPSLTLMEKPVFPRKSWIPPFLYRDLITRLFPGHLLLHIR